MKRIISFIMALAIMLTMSIPVFATGEQDKGSITITNPTLGEVYKLYKIFDATIAVDENGEIIYDDGKPAISYTIDTKVEEVVDGNTVLVDNPVYVAMFTADGSKGADYFTFTQADGENKGYINKVESATTSQIQTYLDNLIDTNEAVRDFAFIDDEKITSDSSNKTITFGGLDYGYYMIDKDNATYVTLTSTTPSVSVIDKNQVPGKDFIKKVWDPELGTWVDSMSASIGDVVDFKIAFEATNYSGEKPVKHYTVKDTKGESLWVEFNSIEVEIIDPSRDNPETTEVNEGIIPLNKGYYHFAGESIPHTNEWTLFGDGWTPEQKEAAYDEVNQVSNHTQFANLADWYLIHRGYDEFDIVIPWLNQSEFTGTGSGFTLEYGDNATSRYSSPVTVVIKYYASVEPSANIGGETPDRLMNNANLSWAIGNSTTSHTDRPGTNITTYAFGLIKVDRDYDDVRLAGATFELYEYGVIKDANGNPVIGVAGQVATHANGNPVLGKDGKPVVGEGGEEIEGLIPVYVLPTDIKGVYIVDDLYATKVISGKKKENARETYKTQVQEYLGADWETAQKNEVVTQVNGKVLIKGLAKGEYYLIETDAPDGYNILPTPTEVNVGVSSGRFFVIKDANGNVYDSQSAAEGQSRYECIADTVTVENSKGVELPSTGGEGAMKLITFGTIVAIAFAALLITHKKMTVYED